MLVSDDWVSKWPDSSQHNLERNYSDHCPIIFNSKNIDWGPKLLNLVLLLLLLTLLHFLIIVINNLLNQKICLSNNYKLSLILCLTNLITALLFLLIIRLFSISLILLLSLIILLLLLNISHPLDLLMCTLCIQDPNLVFITQQFTLHCF